MSAVALIEQHLIDPERLHPLQHLRVDLPGGPSPTTRNYVVDRRQVQPLHGLHLRHARPAIDNGATVVRGHAYTQNQQFRGRCQHLVAPGLAASAGSR